MRMGVGQIAQALAGERNHFIGDVDAVDFDEVAAHGAHDAAGSAADFEGSPGSAFGERDAAQLRFEAGDHFGGGRVKFGVVLIAAAEGYVIARIFTSSRVPIVAHPRGDVVSVHTISGSNTYSAHRA